MAVVDKQGIAARISQLCKEAKAHNQARHLVLLTNGAQATAGMLKCETKLVVVSAGEALLQAQGICV
jgi:hypothetical protein